MDTIGYNHLSIYTYMKFKIGYFGNLITFNVSRMLLKLLDVIVNLELFRFLLYNFTHLLLNVSMNPYPISSQTLDILKAKKIQQKMKYEDKKFNIL